MDAFVEKLLVAGKLVNGKLYIEKISRDPDDDYLLALSKAGKADVLITGDKDHLVLEKYGRTRMMNACSFVTEFLDGK